MRAHRVSSVEAFRQFEADPDAELADVIEKITGEWAGTEATRAGSAFHRALELADCGVSDRMEADGYVFTFADDFDLELTPIRELRTLKTYIVDGQPFAVTGQVDEIAGRMVVDHKTTGRFNPDRYLEGCQWRLYLSLFGADLFRWNVFEMKELEQMHYEITSVHRLEQYRYPALEADCQSLVERYARFWREHMEIAA